MGGKIGGANSAEVVAAVENREMRPLNDVWIVKKLLHLTHGYDVPFLKDVFSQQESLDSGGREGCSWSASGRRKSGCGVRAPMIYAC